MKKVIVELKAIEEFRSKMMDKYGVAELDKDGKETGRLVVPTEKKEVFTKEFIDFLNKDTDLDVSLIPYELIEKSGIKFSSVDLTILSKFIAAPVEPFQER
jgi:hypothetical protein